MSERPDGLAGEIAEDAGGEELVSVYATMYEFFEERLAPAFVRDVGPHGHHRWCPTWWRHPEAVARVHALWRAWEVLRLDGGTGLSDWYRVHADHHMAILLAADGPFALCSATRGHHSSGQMRPFATDLEGLGAQGA